MVFQTINKKLLELGPSLGFLLKKKRVSIQISAFHTYFLTRKTNLNFIFSENQTKDYNVVTSFRERSISSCFITNTNLARGETSLYPIITKEDDMNEQKTTREIIIKK